MKKIIVFTLLLLVTQISYAFVGLYKVTSELGVAARTEPTTSEGYVLTTIKSDEIISIYQIEDGWAQTKYRNKTLYVDVNRITLHKTAEQVQQEKLEAKAEKRARWYDPMNWGFIGWIVRWLLVPIVVFSYIMSVPFKLLAKLRFINNFFLVCICYLLMFIMLPIAVALLGYFDVYSTNGATIALFVLGFFFGRNDIRSISHSRCPNCHYSTSRIIDSYVSRVVTTTITKYSNGSTSESKHSDATLNYQKKCNVCGCEWWVSE